ncbi:MAG TPA: type II toxin-antitoxin system RelE/ParE family toxin [Candidatus Acidoferrales bacterium]|nr:type II toxin-antitoxin system RelE/ParE family toxin [Candidatus Acidoferrales bacterium]
MRVVILDDFRRDFARLPKELRQRTRKALALLEANPHHPSLHTKKMKGPREVWEARVSLSHRIIFTWEADCIILRRVGPHDILKKETS